MLRSWKLGTAFGIGVYVHWTFLLLPMMVAYSVWSEGRDVVALMVSAVVLLAVCIIMHEYGHALMARRFGIQTRDITLYPIGGIARLERMSEKPWEEFWIAVAGPAVNVVIAAVLGISFLAVHQVTALDLDNFGARLVGLLIGMNLYMIIFNMIPAFPMDGGRVFRALLSGWLGHVRATEIAAMVATFFAMVFVVAGMGLLSDRFQSPFLVLIGLFVFLLGQQELAMVRHKAKFGEPEPELLQRPVEFFYTVDAAAVPREPNYSGFTWDGRARVWVEWRDGRPIHACFTD